MGKIEERNERILEIAKELGEPVELFQPQLDPSELPESVLQVNDSMITAAKYLYTKEIVNYPLTLFQICGGQKTPGIV